MRRRLDWGGGGVAGWALEVRRGKRADSYAMAVKVMILHRGVM